MLSLRLQGEYVFPLGNDELGRVNLHQRFAAPHAIFYVLSTGCQWNALPSDLPPKSTVYDYLDLWDWDGTLERIHHALYVAAREQAGREASPSVAIIDAQSAKGAVNGGPRSIPRVTTRARRSKGASATSSSTPLASC
jgi:transposase